MPKDYRIQVIVGVDTSVFYIPDPVDIDFKVGDTIHFSSPHGAVDAQFETPHIFSADRCGDGLPPATVVSVGSFVVRTNVTLSKITVGWPKDPKAGASGSSTTGEGGPGAKT